MNINRWLRLHWDRTAAWVCVAAGAVALIIGWVGVSGTGFPAAQLPYIISGGVGGLFLLGLGAMMWLSADLRDEWLKLDRLEQKVDIVATVLSDQAAGPGDILDYSLADPTVQLAVPSAPVEAVPTAPPITAPRRRSTPTSPKSGVAAPTRSQKTSTTAKAATRARAKAVPAQTTATPRRAVRSAAAPSRRNPS